MNERIDGVLRRVQRTDLAVEELKTAPGDPALVMRIERLVDRAEKQDRRIEALERQTGRIDARVDDVNAERARADDRLAERVDRNATTLENHNKSLEVHRNRLGELAKSVGGPGGLPARTDQAARVAQASAAAGSVWDAVKKINARLEALEKPDPGCASTGDRVRRLEELMAREELASAKDARRIDALETAARRAAASGRSEKRLAELEKFVKAQDARSGDHADRKPGEQRRPEAAPPVEAEEPGKAAEIRRLDTRIDDLQQFVQAGGAAAKAAADCDWLVGLAKALEIRQTSLEVRHERTVRSSGEWAGTVDARLEALEKRRPPEAAPPVEAEEPHEG